MITNRLNAAVGEPRELAWTLTMSSEPMFANAAKLRAYAAQGCPLVVLAACVSSLAFTLTSKLVDQAELLRVVETRAEITDALSVRERAPLQADAIETAAAAHALAARRPEPAAIAASGLPAVRQTKAGASAGRTRLAPSSARAHEALHHAARPVKAEDTQLAPQTAASEPVQVAANGGEPASAHPSPVPVAPAELGALATPDWLLRAAEQAQHEAKPASWSRASTRQEPKLAKVTATAEVEGVQVRGALPGSVVRRGLNRLVPQFGRCSALCSGAQQECLQGQWQLRAVIDETGHGREARVEGSEQPAVQRCIEHVTASLVVSPPDTGVARVNGIVRFQQH